MTTKEDSGAFEFTSNWREFAPVAFTNLLLCIVTLGIYLFWARTRERRFLWSNTRFIDDRLEWTGTGLELLIGYVLAVILFGLPLLGIQFGLQALAIRGYGAAVGGLALLLYLLLLYLAGVAIFRALRYRLSRTYWRGIRGGSDAQGLSFGFSYLWRTIAGSLALGLLIPWSMTTIWNERWNQMSFGPMRFQADAQYGRIFMRYLLFYLVPVAIVVVGVIVGISMARSGGAVATNPQQLQQTFLIGAIVGYFVFFIVLGVVALLYYSAYFREAIGQLSLGDLDFEFTASSWDWFKLVLGSAALIIFTLGIGYLFIGYRNWTFFIRHMQAYGEIKVDELTQSATRTPGQGEGLLDAFDVGAF